MTDPLRFDHSNLNEKKPAWRGSVAIVNNMRYVLAVDERVYCTYIVASRCHTLYIGVTGDLLKRIFEHKQKAHSGFSATYNCNRLVWFERFIGPQGAITREKQLKGWIRAKKIALIVRGNPAWSDLSEGWYAVDPTVHKGR